MVTVKTSTDEPKFKEVYCADCKMVLARYSIKYFTDTDINELVHVHYSAHIKEGHAIETRLAM
ncbi:hypothetical protein NTE_01682 [Candidatus Nitrososphaera evergladensis SR1]|jgi:hypothetical protein|uniref:Uncharacterized protein n=1 Tax=Candidatus Nitrososphaera evergladensis SR1 TaxID=1459636 RepID=A0A075MRG3_9ARCH|nr:hypothetical protein [Candidatus Nitrososphaera evergladensis]AIF83743.1 hypothetical protein NTE_01682 [Candidatus Nitrososphaera evergladensis SR1]